jgi:hypothetical protein
MRNLCILLAISVAMSGCAVMPPPALLTAAADPHKRVPALRIPSASAGTLTFRPVGPSGWGEASPDATPKLADEILKSKKARP